MLAVLKLARIRQIDDRSTALVRYSKDWNWSKLLLGFLSVSFYSNGDMGFTLVSGFISAILFFFFIRNLINNGPCLFGKRNDCHKK